MRWGRILGVAFALEAALFATLVPLQPLLSLRTWFGTVAAACALFGVAAGWLAARGLPSRALLHGTLVGLIATGIYLLLNVFTGGIGAAAAFYGVALFVLVNLLRIAGCAAGAMAARTRVAAIPEET